MPTTHHKISLANQDFQIEIHFRRGLKNINFRIKEPHLIRLSCRPHTSLNQIEKVIQKHQDWILAHQQKIIAHKISNSPRYFEGEFHPYLGKKFPLQINFHHFKRSNLIFADQTFTANICYDLSSKQQVRMIETLFKKFYLRTTKQICAENLGTLQKFQFRPIKSITIKNLRTRWGSCSQKNNLNFSHRLAQLAPELQLYIIVHEYCHLFEMNHSPRFWSKVEEFLPNHKLFRQKLRQLEKSIF